MAADRFVYFKDPHVPTRHEVQTVCEDFFGQAGTVSWKKDRWYIRLRGPSCDPRTQLAVAYGFNYPAEIMRPERWIEVYRHDGPDEEPAIDVITREQDSYTCVLADGLAQFFAGFWKGKREA